MDNGRLTDEVAVRDILGSFMDSYAGRDKSMGFSKWLEEKLRQEMPDMSEEEGRNLAGEIIGAVSDYDRTLADLNNAIDAGQSKEEWFAECLADTYADMPIAIAGEKLQQMEEDVYDFNRRLMQEIDEEKEEGGIVVGPDSVEWNEYSIKDRAYKVGKQISLGGMAVVANVMKDRIRDEDVVDIGNIARQMLQDDIITDPREVKAVVASAVKVAAEKRLVDVPDTAIGDIAGVAVESAEVLYDVVCGKRTMTEAMERIGRAGIAAGCRYCADVLKGFLLEIPVVGSAVAELTGGLFDYMKSPQFAENVYGVVHDAAIAGWEGMKKSVSRKLQNLNKLVYN